MLHLQPALAGQAGLWDARSPASQLQLPARQLPAASNHSCLNRQRHSCNCALRQRQPGMALAACQPRSTAPHAAAPLLSCSRSCSPRQPGISFGVQLQHSAHHLAHHGLRHSAALRRSTAAAASPRVEEQATSASAPGSPSTGPQLNGNASSASQNGSSDRQAVVPSELRDAVAVLEAPNPNAPGGVTQVYVLGVSHASREALGQVRALVAAVQPDIVAVELCCDRPDLLVPEPHDRKKVERSNFSSVHIVGLPPELAGEEARLLGVLRTQPGQPVTPDDVYKRDCRRLMSLGLYSKVTARITPNDAPRAAAQFLFDASGGMPEVITPAGRVDFVVELRPDVADPQALLAALPAPARGVGGGGGQQGGGDSKSEPAGTQRQPQHLRVWREEELVNAAWNSGEEERGSAGGGPGQALAGKLMQTFGNIQGEAGRKAGVGHGAAWQASMAAAAACGAAQVQLIDRPIDVTIGRLGISMGLAAAQRLVAVGAIAAFWAVAATVAPLAGAPPPPGALAAVATVGGAAVAAWPFIAPLLQVKQLAGMSAAEIEEAVRVKERLQGSTEPYLLWGEDALISWPGVDQPLLHERDAYMAAALWAAATGRGAVPAYVAEPQSEGGTLWRYAMAAGAPRGACPAGAGEGVYEPLQAPRAVVAVVGTAHVRGMCAAWRRASGSDLLGRLAA